MGEREDESHGHDHPHERGHSHKPGKHDGSHRTRLASLDFPTTRSGTLLQTTPLGTATLLRAHRSPPLPGVAADITAAPGTVPPPHRPGPE